MCLTKKDFKFYRSVYNSKWEYPTSINSISHMITHFKNCKKCEEAYSDFVMEIRLKEYNKKNKTNIKFKEHKDKMISKMYIKKNKSLQDMRKKFITALMDK